MRQTPATLILVLLFTACEGNLRFDQAVDEDGGVVVPPGRHHPLGFAAPGEHGPALIQRGRAGAEDCRACHGDTLEGTALAPSCDSCHDAAEPTRWRTTCTFCHGGDENQTGAPPRNLDGSHGPGVFPAHGEHVGTQLAAAIDCVQCHVKAKDVLSEGHVFDDTPGVADLDFGAGLSPQTSFTAAAGCSTNYCHGSGQAQNGQVAIDAPAMTCTSCHAGQDSGATGWQTMSGMHALHLGQGDVTCGDCHQAVTADGAILADASLHVNGKRDLAFSEAGFTFDPQSVSCTGSCHGENHQGLGWGSASGKFHPEGFADPGQHGPEMSLGRQDCRACHGETLTGGAVAPSCDSCHQADWRTDCTYCHGGTSNQTGAPGRDPGAPAGSVSARFLAHTRHVDARVVRSYDCTECHVKPVDALTAGHIFDPTPGAGEVRFTAGLSPSASFAEATGTCSSTYCHGNGRGDNGTVVDGAAPMTCRSCHPGLGSGSAAFATMSGDHRRHIGEDGITCADCHRNVTADGATIAQVALHVDRAVATQFPAGFSYNASTRRCTGSCHGENHNETW